MLLLATNQAANFTAYQEMKKYARRVQNLDELPSYQHLLLGGISGAMGKYYIHIYILIWGGFFYIRKEKNNAKYYVNMCLCASLFLFKYDQDLCRMLQLILSKLVFKSLAHLERDGIASKP